MGLTGIRLNSVLKFTVTVTSEGLYALLKGLMPSWRNYHCIALVLGTIHQTINCVYLQLPSGNPPSAELKALQMEQ
jgi:hypothetical protein